MFSFAVFVCSCKVTLLVRSIWISPGKQVFVVLISESVVD